MTHARQQIRALVAGTTLASLASLTGSRQIYRSRSRPITQYPSIAVFNGPERFTTENPEWINSASKRYLREFQLTIEVAVKTNMDPDDALDALCVGVEHAMAADNTMGGGVQFTDLSQVTFTKDGNGEEEIHTCRMTYLVTYRTAAADVETFIS